MHVDVYSSIEHWKTREESMYGSYLCTSLKLGPADQKLRVPTIFLLFLASLKLI